MSRKIDSQHPHSLGAQRDLVLDPGNSIGKAVSSPHLSVHLERGQGERR
ncbi:MAG: hypothetical protein WC314_17125 [Vulcanimicrobiota bacterium]